MICLMKWIRNVMKGTVGFDPACRSESELPGCKSLPTPEAEPDPGTVNDELNGFLPLTGT